MSDVLLLVHVDAQASTILSNLLAPWRVQSIAARELGGYSPAEGDSVGLVVLQSMGDDDDLERWCRQTREHPALKAAPLVVGLDPDLARQYGLACRAGANECLMIPASAGHVEKLLRRVLGDRLPDLG